jgi:hypothetical protein
MFSVYQKRFEGLWYNCAMKQKIRGMRFRVNLLINLRQYFSELEILFPVATNLGTQNFTPLCV